MPDIEGIERATLAALPPQRVQECEGWLVALDDGTVGRAHSAAPLAHGAPRAGSVAAVERLYRSAGLRPLFRVPRLAALEDALERSGCVAARPTLVQWKELGAARTLDRPPQGALRLAPQGDEDWAGVFLGEGFDPVDGASRLAILRRAQGTLYASIVVDGVTVAVGCGAFSHGWASVHGLRTLPAQRGRGHAQRIIAALEQAARARGLQRIFLQVEQGNPARALYARLGFADAWTYRYWGPAP